MSDLPDEIWIYPEPPKTMEVNQPPVTLKHGSWVSFDTSGKHVKYTRTDERAEMQAAIVELRDILSECLGAMTGGMDGTWSEEFDPIHGARQTLNNTKKWS